MTDRTFDLVVYGATGFTGGLVAAYLHGERPTLPSSGPMRWAIAGRSRERLEAVRTRLGAPDLPIVVADSQDAAALDAMTSQTRVLLSTVGPFYAYGQEVVASCVRNGTDYCDLTGENHFVRAMDRKHDDAAKASGARIVHNAGYDSIPSDLGTWMMHTAMQERGATLQSVTAYARMKGGLSGGTIDSMRKSIALAATDKEVRRAMADPYALYPEGVERGPKARDAAAVAWDPDVQSWVAPFVMAGTNAPVVRRSNALMGFPYGKGFRYSECTTTGTGFGGRMRAVRMAAGLGGFLAGMTFPPTRWLLDKVLPSPGEGPDEQAREAGWFEHRFVAKGVDADGAPVELRGKVAGDKDPGYGSTALMIGETAMCLAFDDRDKDAPGGILTPASALGSTLIERLRTAGMTFEIE